MEQPESIENNAGDCSPGSLGGASVDGRCRCRCCYRTAAVARINKSGTMVFRSSLLTASKRMATAAASAVGSFVIILVVLVEMAKL